MSADSDLARGAAAALAVLAVLLALAGSARPAAAAAPPVSPALLRTVSSGVVLIRTSTCAGRALGSGTGFLVGASVVMTTRDVLDGACKVRVTLRGGAAAGVRWVSWTGPGVSAASSNLATIALDRRPRGAHVFTIRSSSPPAGTSLGTAGYGRGSTLYLERGPLVWKGRKAGAPLLAAGMRAATTADGAPVVDAAGRVVGILQKARGSRDVAGSRTAAVLEGLDLARWWGRQARAVLCSAYPKAVAGCAGVAPAPGTAPSPVPDPGSGSETDPGSEGGTDPDPDPTPSPPRAPGDYTVRSCWVQYTGDSWDDVAAARAAASIPAADLLAKGPGNYWSVVQLTDGAPAAIRGVTASLVSPTGFVSPGSPFTWDEDAEAAAWPLDWQVSATGDWFFQNPLYPRPQQWTVRWTFPNGQSCSARFTVT
jgi:hypothetical protein